MISKINDYSLTILSFNLEEVKQINKDLFTDQSFLEQHLTFEEIGYIINDEGKAIGSSVLTFEEFDKISGLNIK